MKLTIDPFVADDARELVIQRAQRFDLPDAEHIARIEALAGPGRAFTLRDRASRRVLCIAGVAEQAAHYGTGWAVLADDKGGAAMLAITRAVRRYLEMCDFRIVDCLVHAGQLSARKWARRLGFEPEARLEGRAPDQGDMIVYIRKGAG